MGKARNLADLLDDNGDVKSASLDNVPASNNASALTTGTLPIARIADDAITNAKLATGITASKLTGTIPNFTSTGIDDNADATAITIDSSEKVGIGTTSPACVAKGLHIQTSSAGTLPTLQADADDVVVEGSTPGITLMGATNGGGMLAFGDTDDADVGQIFYYHVDNSMRFKANGTERMRIASTQLLIGATAAAGISNSNSNYGLALSGGGQITSGTNNDTNAIFNMSNGSNEHHVLFRSDGTTTGYISTSGSSVAYNTGSDYRLKENVDYTWDATTRLKQLKPARFNFIADDTNTLVDGFIAHEVQDIVPEAISGAKDAVDSDGNIDPQGIDQSKLVPLLVKTIQELEARITALEA